MTPTELSHCVSQYWRPVIGDPEWTGWLTVLGYALCAVLAIRVAARRPAVAGRGFWVVVVMVMVFLGINKQLDLQSALTAAGRCLAHAQGWYDDRARVQLAMILGLLAASVIALLVMAIALRHSLRSNGLALMGLAVLACFVMVRAVGFHHVDRLIGRDFSGISYNFLFENAGLALIALNAALLTRRRPAQSRPPVRPASP